MESRKPAKFYLCPAPPSQDSHLFYEAIYTGAIPIVVREPFHDIFVKQGIYIHFVAAMDSVTERELVLKSEVPQVSQLPPFLDISHQVNVLSNITKIREKLPRWQLTDDEVEQVENFAKKSQKAI